MLNNSIDKGMGSRMVDKRVVGVSGGDEKGGSQDRRA